GVRKYGQRVSHIISDNFSHKQNNRQGGYPFLYFQVIAGRLQMCQFLLLVLNLFTACIDAKEMFIEPSYVHYSASLCHSLVRQNIGQPLTSEMNEMKSKFTLRFVFE